MKSKNEWQLYWKYKIELMLAPIESRRTIIRIPNEHKSLFRKYDYTFKNKRFKNMRVKII